MLRLSSVVPSPVAYPALSRPVTAEQNVVAAEFVALVARRAAAPSSSVLLSGASTAATGPSRPYRRVGLVVGMTLRAVGDLLLPKPAALNGVSHVALPCADVQVRGVDAWRVVASVTGILNACLLPYEGSTAQLSEEPSVGPLLSSLGVEDAVSALVSSAHPGPAFGLFAAFNLGPELGGYFNICHAIHSTPRAISNGVI